MRYYLFSERLVSFLPWELKYSIKVPRLVNQAAGVGISELLFCCNYYDVKSDTAAQSLQRKRSLRLCQRQRSFSPSPGRRAGGVYPAACGLNGDPCRFVNGCPAALYDHLRPAYCPYDSAPAPRAVRRCIGKSLLNVQKIRHQCDSVLVDPGDIEFLKQFLAIEESKCFVRCLAIQRLSRC